METLSNLAFALLLASVAYRVKPIFDLYRGRSAFRRINPLGWALV